MDVTLLRDLLGRPGSYPVIAAAGAAGQLHRLFAVTLFDHIGHVYDRLERFADARGPELAPLRLTVLVHEVPPDAVPRLLGAAGLAEFEALAVGVLRGFGELWKATSEREMAAFVEAHRAHLEALLLFELAHEGSATESMRWAAESGGLSGPFDRWAGRLPRPDGPTASGLRGRRPVTSDPAATGGYSSTACAG